jgi:hypothetical protein
MTEKKEIQWLDKARLVSQYTGLELDKKYTFT